MSKNPKVAEKAKETKTVVKTNIELFIVTLEKEDSEIKRNLYFTSHEAPVTVGGVQYIPLSVFDQAKHIEDLQ